ncbi:hypothetical protein HPB48_018433 [Haemaphysalis longicornis]|uniref:Uncharacterized protein n=1 Tax=Haemaphysalis longicornis TaxID=44386 RepID=A0A9J6GGA1_HAELO|nr:hypothetical protein HPB48_018433 [Haemaphysalis longicornis]
MDDPTSAELPKAKRKHAKKARKKERRDKRREKKDRKKKGKDKFSADEAEGLDDNLHATEFQLGDRETDVAWSPDVAHPQVAEREPGFEVFYEMLVSELGRLREKVGDHERQLVDTAGPLIGRLPRPQQPYITGTCCCTKCCGRCCDMHEPITEDAGTDVDEEALDAEEADWRSRRKKNAPVEADMDTSSDFSYSGESSKGGKVRRTSTKLSRKKTDEVKRTPARTHIRSSPDLDTSSSELRRASLARISRKSLSKSKSASYRPGTLPSTKETPVRPLRDKLGEVEQLDAVDSFRQIPDLERLLRLDDTDDRELPRGRGLRDDPLGAPYGRWKSPTSNNAAFAWPPQKPYDNWSAGQIVYYAEPASEAFLRAVQSAPMNVYSARMPPEVIPPYATRQQYDEWPPYTPEAPPPYQERRLSPLTAAALELSGRADAVTRQARGTLEAARVLKRASDGALKIAMEGQYTDNGIYDRPPLEGQESEVSDTYLTPRSAQSMTSASQTSRPSSIESRKLSNANGFSEKKATHQKPAEKRKRKLSGAERRRSSLAEEKGHEEASLQRSTALAPSAEAVRNVNDLEKGDNLIATTKLSDALLNINPPDAGSEDVGGSSKRRGSRKESVGPRKPSTALESKPWRPSADASTGANRRRSSASETAAGAGLTATTERRRSSVAAEEKRQPRRDSGNLLRRESAQSERESVKLPVEAQPTSRHGSLRMHDNLAEPLRIVDMKQDAEEVPNAATVLLDDQAEDDAALRMDSDRSDLVRKLSLVKALQKRASFGEISGIEVRHSDLSAHGAGDVALEEDTGADESWAHEKTSEKKVASFQSDVSRLFLQTPEREAQLTAVVTVPYKQDAKLWCYKDSTRSLFPESRLGVTTAFVCAGWIILLIFLSEYHHNWFYIHTTSSLSQTTFSPSRATGPPPTYNPDIFTHRPTFPRGTTARPDTHQPMDIYFCATEHCDKEARYLFSSLKDNPCENFYENVCANSRSLWAQRYAGSAVSTTSLLAAQIQALTEEYIADDYNNDVKVARTLFSACVDWDEHREKSVAAALRMINEILGISWPVDSRARTFLPDPWHAAGELARKLNLEPLATLSVDVHPEKRRELILGLDEPSVLHRLNKGQDLRNLVATSVEEVTRRIDAKEIADAILETMFTISDLAAPPSVRVLGPENYRVTPLGEMGSRVKSMLSSVLAGYNIVEDSTGILVKSPSFFANLRAPNALTSGGLLNYLGYRVLLHFATFVSLPSLEQVRALVTRGYVNTGETTRRGLCSWEVSRVLPAMYTRAFFRRIRNTSFDVVARAWSSQIEQRFQSGLARLSWFREPRYSSADPADLHLANHKLSTSRIQHFYPSWIMNDAMYSKYEERVRARLDRVPTSAFAYLRALHEARFAEKIAPLAGSAADLAFSANIFDASPRYDVQRNSLFVPASMMNVSVPTNGSLFALHIARFGVRTMRALVAALYNDFVFSGRRSDGASDAPLLFTEGYDLRLRNTTRCLVDEYRRVPDSLKSSFMRGLSDLSAAAFSLLEQTVALMQAFWAFQEMLTVKRVWRSDFRFSLLPHMSSDQIFFVYYALDNCEASDDSYRARVFEERFELPPEERVNFPLLHMDAFKRAFGCPASSPMATASNCTVAS